jgi:hypothetical protein
MEQYNFYGPSGGLSIREEDGKITLLIVPSDHAFIKDVQFKISNSAAKEVVDVLQKIVARIELKEENDERDKGN